MESVYENYTGINISHIYDGDNSTCVDLRQAWTYIPMTTLRYAWNVSLSHFFGVTASVSDNLSLVTGDNLMVFIRKQGMNTEPWYKDFDIFTKCRTMEVSGRSHRFGCSCDLTCSVYVRVFFQEMTDAFDKVELCEVNLYKL